MSWLCSVFVGCDVAIGTTVIVILPHIVVLHFLAIAVLPPPTAITKYTLVTGTFHFTATRQHYTLH